MCRSVSRRHCASRAEEAGDEGCRTRSSGVRETAEASSRGWLTRRSKGDVLSALHEQVVTSQQQGRFNTALHANARRL